MLIIPTKPVAAQTISVLLAQQDCQIVISQKSTGMYLDLYVGGALIIGGVICENLNRIVRSLYLGFVGDLAFLDTEGAGDPVYTGLGTRYLLAYIEQSELPAGQG